MRLLWHSNRTKIGHRFLLADGSGHPALTAFLQRSHQIFPNLDIEHVVYDDDGSFNGYYRRTADAARRVSTSYVMNCGDDDLIFAAGLAPCIEFLEKRKDYVCCGGVVAGFSLAEDSPSGQLPLVGPLARLKFPAGRYYRPRDIDQETALDRLTIGYSDYLSSYHNLFRSEVLADIYGEVEEQDFSVIHLREAFLAMRTFAAGKVKTDPAVVHFFRQRRVGDSAGGDLIRAAFRPAFSAEFERMVARLAQMVSRVDGVEPASAESEIRDAYAEFFRRKAAGSGKKARTFGPAKAMKDDGGSDNKRPSTDPEDMYKALAKDGANDAYIQTFRSQFEETVKALRGEEFTEFLRAHAPEVVEAHQRG
jgi:glycosyltransferase domain-containing protein